MKPGSHSGRSWVFPLAQTPVRVKPAVLLNLIALWVGLAWLAGRRRPHWSRAVRWLAGMLDMMALAAADFGHAFAHIASARAAGAPVDEIFISSGMPRTLYWYHDVPPNVHRTRAIGGPIYSAIGFVTSALLGRLSPHGSLVREVASWSSIGHGLILGGSLLPLPVVDGGTLLKWTLVERGHSEAEAETVVRQAALVMAAGSGAAGLAAVRRCQWLMATGFLGVTLLLLGGGVAEVH
jgi:hypothetical protein